jgi:predicted N-acetyltransferase YhbS
MVKDRKISYELLNLTDSEQIIQAVEVLHVCFSGNERYTVDRLVDELKPDRAPFYRQFFVASLKNTHHPSVVGVAGIKSAEWATETHILYLSAVHPEFRNQGIGRALVKARMAWLKSNFNQGRVIVSTSKQDRFKQLGFHVAASRSFNGKVLMMTDW